MRIVSFNNIEGVSSEQFIVSWSEKISTDVVYSESGAMHLRYLEFDISGVINYDGRTIIIDSGEVLYYLDGWSNFNEIKGLDITYDKSSFDSSLLSEPLYEICKRIYENDSSITKIDDLRQMNFRGDGDIRGYYQETVADEKDIIFEITNFYVTFEDVLGVEASVSSSTGEVTKIKTLYYDDQYYKVEMASDNLKTVLSNAFRLSSEYIESNLIE